MVRIVPTILLHFLHPWMVRCRRYDHKEVGGRVAPGAATENNVRNSYRESNSCLI